MDECTSCLSTSDMICVIPVQLIQYWLLHVHVFGISLHFITI
uniref:Uncharacterized protein n=1 Tax=Arundo donax TaxID=35708 RepID=A0A0A9BYC1_ARUDO